MREWNQGNELTMIDVCDDAEVPDLVQRHRGQIHRLQRRLGLVILCPRGVQTLLPVNPVAVESGIIGLSGRADLAEQSRQPHTTARALPEGITMDLDWRYT